jgi:hypothetical protein
MRHGIRFVAQSGIGRCDVALPLCVIGIDLQLRIEQRQLLLVGIPRLRCLTAKMQGAGEVTPQIRILWGEIQRRLIIARRVLKTPRLIIDGSEIGVTGLGGSKFQ